MFYTRRGSAGSLKEHARRLLCATSAYRLFGSTYYGCGSIFALHRVVPGGAPRVADQLSIHVDVLRAVLEECRCQGIELVDMGAVPDLLANPTGKRFAAFTFDDGYRDNWSVARPVFEEYDAPLCVYICTGFLDRSISCWWGGLERLLEESATFDLASIGCSGEAPTETILQKRAVYSRAALEAKARPDLVVPLVQRAVLDSGISESKMVDEDFLSRGELREMALHPLYSVGAHSVTHRAMACLPEGDALMEMVSCAETIEQVTGRRPQHFAYPFGGGEHCGEREFRLAMRAGFKTGVTMRTANVFDLHKDHLFALPRVPLSGEFFSRREFGMKISGVVGALKYRMKRVITD